MQFPAGFGLSGFDLPDGWLERYHRTLLQLQGQGGYTSEPESVRDLELRLIALIAALGGTAIERALNQIFPSTASETLNEHEHGSRLKNDSARSDEERQARLVAAKRMQVGAVRASMIDALESIGLTAPDIVSNTRAHVVAAGAEPEAIFQTVVHLAAEDWADPQKRDAVADLYPQLLPAHSVGQLGRLEPRDTLVSSVDARWSDADQRLNQTAIAQKLSPTRDPIRAPARLRSYGPLTNLRAQDLNAIQDGILLADPEGVALPDYVPDQAAIVAAFQSAGGSNKTLDTSINWRDRYLYFTGRVTTTDMRPGAADDDDYNAATQVAVLGYTGSGSTGAGLGSEYELRTGSLRIYAHITTGNLMCFNGSGTTYYVTLWLTASGELGKR